MLNYQSKDSRPNKASYIPDLISNEGSTVISAMMYATDTIRPTGWEHGEYGPICRFPYRCRYPAQKFRMWLSATYHHTDVWIAPVHLKNCFTCFICFKSETKWNKWLYISILPVSHTETDETVFYTGLVIAVGVRYTKQVKSGTAIGVTNICTIFALSFCISRI